MPEVASSVGGAPEVENLLTACAMANAADSVAVENAARYRPVRVCCCTRYVRSDETLLAQEDRESPRAGDLIQL